MADTENNAAPEAKPQADKTAKIDHRLLEDVLDAIRPSFQADGGDVELIDVNDEGVVTLEMQGACAGCPLSSMDMSEGIERILMEHVPGVTKVQPALI